MRFKMDISTEDFDNCYKFYADVPGDYAGGEVVTADEVTAIEAERDALRQERASVAEIIGGTFAVGALPIYLRSIVDGYQDTEQRFDALRRSVEPWINEAAKLLEMGWRGNAFVGQGIKFAEDEWKALAAFAEDEQSDPLINNAFLEALADDPTDLEAEERRQIARDEQARCEVEHER